MSWDELEFTSCSRGASYDSAEQQEDNGGSSPSLPDVVDEDGVAVRIPFERMFPYKRSPQRRRWTPRLGFGNLVEELREREEWIVVYDYDGGVVPSICVCLTLHSDAS